MSAKSASQSAAQLPNDETGLVLQEMHAAGIDLTLEHQVVFFQLFEQKEQAEAMAGYLAEKYLEMEVNLHPDEIPNVWDLDVSISMVPSYDNIITQEQMMEKIAAKFNGYNDGWGIEA